MSTRADESVSTAAAPAKDSSATFADRHIGPDADGMATMLHLLDQADLEALEAAAVPADHPDARAAEPAGARFGDRDARRAARAGGEEPAAGADDRSRLPRHHHPRRDQAERAGEPGLVHRLHAVSAGDLAGSAGGAAELPDRRLRPDRAGHRQRVDAGRGHRGRRGDDADQTHGQVEIPALRRRRRHAAADHRRRSRPGPNRSASRSSSPICRRVSRRCRSATSSGCCSPTRGVRCDPRPSRTDRGRPSARGEGRRGDGSVGPDAAPAAGRDRRRRRGRVVAALRGAARFRRPARGVHRGP